MNENIYLSEIIITTMERASIKNIEAFIDFGTEHKKDIGGKGLGRVSYLQIAEKIKVASKYKIENTSYFTSFNFTDRIKKQM